MAELDRRDFLKLVSAGAGAAAASGCSDPVEKLIPYVVQPEEITPGLPVVYASTCQECSAGCGLHVRTREGRPIKLEGNPEHPVNRGALCARGQAGIERTYSPDRYRGPKRRGADGALEDIGWEEATRLLAEKIGAAGAKTRLLGGPTGPTLSRLLDQWVGAVGAGGRVTHDPFDRSALARASEAVFGVASPPVFDLSSADFVLSFGADFLESGPSPVEHARQLAEARDVLHHPKGGARFVYVGPRLSQTAANADEWIAAKPGSEGVLALAIARAALESGGAPSADRELLEGVLAGFDVASASARTGVPAAVIRELGQALARSERPVALPPGIALSSRRAVAANAAVLVLNAVAGAVGKTLRYPAGPSPAGGADPFRDTAELVAAMGRGEVQVLLVHGANPAYSLPPGLGFAEARKKVHFVVSFASSPDETSALADLVLPDHTPLESWGDAEPRPGVRSLVQPTLRPLFDTQALGDTLLQTARAMGDEVAAKLPSGSFRSVVEAAWSGVDLRAALARGGVFETPQARGVALSPGLAKLDFSPAPLAGDGSYVLLPTPSPLLGDGGGANLSWLQETPDPVTSVAWQSWAELSHRTASALGVGTGDMLAIETPAGTLEVPAFPRGGILDDVIAVPTGQGHRVGSTASRAGAPRGVNVVDALPAATDEAGGRAWLATRARLRKTGGFERLALTQTSDNQRGRQIAEAVTLSALANGDGKSGHGGHGEAAAGEHGGGHGNGHGEASGHGEAHEIHKPYDPRDDAVDESPYRWGMTIDLDRCNGCAACVVACAMENNIPSVGEEGTLRARQMTWIRIERYIGDGEPELQAGRPPRRDRERLGELDVRHVPMLCQHCGAAPCEPVCPVYATYHSPEGLNGMIYNRCIGTRYCSNNCPYKVRRFNWFDYSIENWPEPSQLRLNPDVTVRGQGVMEKCTFCVQRVEAARQTAKDEGRPIADGEATPACAQTCAPGAIRFGNLRDEGSAVSQNAAKGAARGYHALHVLNTRPSITYLAKVRRGDGSHS